MRTFERVCIEDYTLAAANGDCLRLKRGDTYITSGEHDDGTVTVFTNFWVRVNPSLFAGARVFTGAASPTAPRHDAPQSSGDSPEAQPTPSNPPDESSSGGGR